MIDILGEIDTKIKTDEAERVGWSEPGVSYVDNRLLVEWLYVT